MADKKRYDEYLYYLSTLLKQEDFYSDFSDQISQGKNSFQVSQRFQKQIFDESWIDTLEDCIVALDTIVRNPRKFIVVEEDIVDISLARSISVESVKHLAQHTNFISSVTKDGMVIPSKILNTSKEESYEIYENRFIYTLLLKTKDFISRRYNLIKQANANSDQIVVNVTSDFGLDKDSNITYTMSTTANMPVESVVGTTEDHSLIERVERINSIVGSFLASHFAKEMVSCALVRPPITRTNVILKDPNFKKALVLWQFIESYNKVGFEVETVTETRDLAPAVAEKYRDLIYLNTLVIESMAARAEGGIIEEKELEEKKNLENEYLTKNIDDFVPDDFPQLHMDLHEIRRLYTTVPGEREVPMEDIKKMNAALDRVIRQHKINIAKEDSARQKALLKQQLKEEAQLKLEALKQAEKDAKEAEKRRIQEEKERIRAQKEAEKA
ncbi:MAG: cell envelope integrity protein TolA, partial [Clostridia bacterium]|nr:cell envelope integrity protein TolA [Clostridia bacterium]